MLDRLWQEVDTFRLKLWLDDYYSYADNYQFYIPSWTTSDDRDKYTSDFYDKTFSLRRVDSDVFQRLESFHSLDNQHKYIEYIHAIVDGLNTPHQDVALYKRCLKTINDFVDFAHKNNDNLTEVTIEGYIRVWLTEGAFSGILSIVQKFVAGSLVDKFFFDAVIHFFGLFNMYHDTRIIPLGMKNEKHTHTPWCSANKFWLCSALTTQKVQNVAERDHSRVHSVRALLSQL